MNNPAVRRRRTRATVEQAWQWCKNRTTSAPAWVVITQLFIGFGWLRAVVEKLIEPQWWTGAHLLDFVTAHQDNTLGWYQPFVDAVVVPAAVAIALIVVITQAGAAVSLLSARRLTAGLAIGIFLNLNFLAAGAVEPSTFYLLAQGSLALWLAEERRSTLSVRSLVVAAGSAAVLGVISLPFISTLHPARVIWDPAIMFAFGGALTALACMLVINSVTTPRNGPQHLVDSTGGAFSARIGAH